jgi:hypothetical protein
MYSIKAEKYAIITPFVKTLNYTNIVVLITLIDFGPTLHKSPTFLGAFYYCSESIL